jgi:hypothetical protein
MIKDLRKLISLVVSMAALLLGLMILTSGCGTMWDWTFGNPFKSAEEQIAEKCVEQTDSIEAQTGMMAAAAALNTDVDTKFYVCADNFFEERQETPRNALCLPRSLPYRQR